jgi:hypothetical protein
VDARRRLDGAALPAGAKIKSLPSPAKGSNAFGTYELVVDSSGGALHVRTRITLDRTRIGTSDYGSFRAWCEEVDRALGQRATVTLR